MGERLLKHGLLVLFFSFVLDTASSWAMMTLRGVSSEGNATIRLLFQQRTGQVLMTWLVSQYAWFLFLLLGILGLVFLDLHRRLQSGIAKKVVSLTFRAVLIYGVIFTWIPGVLRYIYGVGSNIAGLLFPLGPYAQIV